MKILRGESWKSKLLMKVHDNTRRITHGNGQGIRLYMTRASKMSWKRARNKVIHEERTKTIVEKEGNEEHT